MRAFLWAIAFLFGAPAGPAFNAEPSPNASVVHSVGFRVLERTDPARASKRFPNGRPIQIVFWFPAASASPQVSYGDYVGLAAREIAFGPPNIAAENAALAQFKRPLLSAGATPEEAEAALTTAMRGSRNASPEPGRFPLVLLAQGNGQSAHDQAFLAELLAARGYVVATVPSQARIGGPMESEQEIPAQAEDQAADLAFALRAVRFESPVRPGKYGIIAHSFGARSALLLAMRDPDVAALVSLDGGIGSKVGKGMLEKATGFRRTHATAPILHFYEEADPAMIPDLELLGGLDRADRWLVKVDGMRHSKFARVGALVRSVPVLAKATSAEDRTPIAWDAVAEATASFLDRFVADSPVAKKRSGRWTPPESPLLHWRSLPAIAASPSEAAPKGR